MDAIEHICFTRLMAAPKEQPRRQLGILLACAFMALLLQVHLSRLSSWSSSLEVEWWVCPPQWLLWGTMVISYNQWLFLVPLQGGR